jgi:hypothetical protein
VLSSGGFVAFVLAVCWVRYGHMLEVLDNGADRIMAVWFWLCLSFVRILFFRFFMLINV